jgi:hypothetical protein
MNWNEHWNLKNKHAFMGASQYHWLNDDEERFKKRYNSYIAAQRGTELHEIAAQLIKHGIKQQKNKKTFNCYVNDAIGYHMRPEQILYYSNNCFGTADAITFSKGMLRIHDLKTGVMPASMNQLFIYDALFCLEYDIKPGDIKIENRIYQNDEILVAEPTSEQIVPIMNKIITFDKIMNTMMEE